VTFEVEVLGLGRENSEWLLRWRGGNEILRRSQFRRFELGQEGTGDFWEETARGGSPFRENELDIGRVMFG